LKRVLETRLGYTYLAVIAVGIAFQLIIVPGFILWRYRAAVKVFLQRDDGKRNLDWCLWFRDGPRGRYLSMVMHGGLPDGQSVVWNCQACSYQP